MNFAEYEHLIEELEDLRELSETLPIIVEGRRDEKALRELGVETEFFHVSSGTALYELGELIVGKYSDVILLTDLDKAGNKLAKRLKSILSQGGVRVNERFRLSLMSKLDTHQVENLCKRLIRVKRQLKKV